MYINITNVSVYMYIILDNDSDVLEERPSFLSQTNKDVMARIMKFSQVISRVKWLNGERNQRFEDCLWGLHYTQSPGKQQILHIMLWLQTEIWSWIRYGARRQNGRTDRGSVEKWLAPGLTTHFTRSSDSWCSTTTPHGANNPENHDFYLRRENLKSRKVINLRVS